MIRFFKKPFRFATVFSVLLTLCTAFVFLDTFVIPHPQTQAATITSTQTQASTGGSAAQAVVSSKSYEDENIKITIKTLEAYNTVVYIADVQLSSVEYLKTALANNTFGRNISASTSSIAKSNNAIFAINGDYYGFRNYGLVLRDGVLYRNASGSSLYGQALLIDSDGNFSIADESSLVSGSLVSQGIWQGLSFGPALIENGQIAVNANSEVKQSMTSNPRTAIGQISALHYIFVVSDGRTGESEGLSLLQLAQIMKENGCTLAYNLDGGGSSTMWFNGAIVNKPTTNGKTIAERSVSDIVYIGY